MINPEIMTTLGTQDEDKNKPHTHTRHNMSRTPLNANKHK
jgi:hypothetical protein